MSKLDDYSGLVAECQPAAADALIDRICGTEWATAGERYAAQALVIRLERLKWRADDREPGRGDYAGAAFLPDGRRPRSTRQTRPAPKVAG